MRADILNAGSQYSSSGVRASIIDLGENLDANRLEDASLPILKPKPIDLSGAFAEIVMDDKRYRLILRL